MNASHDKQIAAKAVIVARCIILFVLAMRIPYSKSGRSLRAELVEELSCVLTSTKVWYDSVLVRTYVVAVCTVVPVLLYVECGVGGIAAAGRPSTPPPGVSGHDASHICISRHKHHV